MNLAANRKTGIASGASTPHRTLSRLYHAACTLSVYASQPRLPPNHAITRVRLVAFSHA